MPNHPTIYIGDDTLAELIGYCQTRDLRSFVLVADRNTHAVLGGRVEQALANQGWDVLTALLQGEEVVADARSVMQVMYALDRAPRTFLAVGSGTITDIARFVSHRAGREFISLPTAPSVDGYTSIGAPMVLDGAKITVYCHAPLGVFADLPTLCAAPRVMIAAGFGDMLAKLTSVADWELGALVWDEPFDPEIARRSRDAAWACAHSIDAIAAAEPAGVRALIEGLIESGLCILDFGETRPASGAEHHMSHLWEMKLLREGRPAVLHGAKVGIGVVLSLQRFDAVRRMSRGEAETRLARSRLPDREAEIRGIGRAFVGMADQLAEVQKPFLDMTEAEHIALKDRVLAHWDDIERISAGLPSAAEMTGWLRKVGGPVAGREVGLSDEEIALGVRWGHYYRNRFTVAKLSQMLGMP